LPSPKQGRDGTRKLFTRNENFRYFPTPTVTISSPECGPSGSDLTARHAADGQNSFPSLVWQAPPDTMVHEYLIVVEDADVPLSSPELHGIYYGIPASLTNVEAASFDKVKKGTFERKLAGDFKYCPIGRGFGGKVWIGPNPMLNHGPHRYFFQVIALNATIDRRELSQFPTKESFIGAVEGKVVGWGEWVGQYERRV